MTGYAVAITGLIGVNLLLLVADTARTTMRKFMGWR